MKSSARKQKPCGWHSFIDLKIKSSWAAGMNRLAAGLSPSKLRLCVIIFMLLGTGCCIYTAFQGISGQSQASIGRDGIAVIKNAYRFEADGKCFFDRHFWPERKQAVLSSYIDSVVKSSTAIDLRKADQSGTENLYGVYGSETSTTNDNKFNYGK